MHIIDTVESSTERRRKKPPTGRSDLPLSTFTWNKTFIESCQADNLRQLDLDEYFSLKSAISKRLYRFLGKRFYLQGEWTFDLNEIAFDRVGLSRSYEGNAGKIKEKLQPAIDELEAIGFLRPLSRDDRYSRIDRGQWTIRLTRQSPALAAPAAIATPLPSRYRRPWPPSWCAAASPARWRRSWRKHPAETIQAKIDVFDWMMEKQDKRLAKSPAGYLVKSICRRLRRRRKAFSVQSRAAAQGRSPPGQGTRAGRRHAAASRRKKRRERAEKQAINDYWNR